MVDRADISSVLAQMRNVRAQMDSNAQGPAAIKPPAMSGLAPTQQVEGSERTDFGALLKKAIDSVNEQQTSSKSLSEAYDRGDPGVDLPQVMIQAQKASVSFQALVQVRNRLVSAYEDVMRMSI